MVDQSNDLENAVIAHVVQLNVPKTVFEGDAAKTVWGLVGRNAFNHLFKSTAQRDAILKSLGEKKRLREPKQHKFQLIG